MTVPKHTLKPGILPRYVMLLAAIWTGLLIFSLVGSFHQEYPDALETVRTTAWSQRGLPTPLERGFTQVNLAYLTQSSEESAPPRTARNQRLGTIWLRQGVLWLLGLAGIGLGAALLDRSGIEMELEEANRTLEGLIEAAPWAVVGLDPQGCVCWWSPAATRIFGWRAHQVVGQPPPFLSEDVQPEFRELYARGLQGERVGGVAVCHHRNGMAVDISFSMSPLYGPEDQLAGVVAVLEDITERQNTEKELFRVNEQLKSWVFEFSRRNRDITLLNQMGDLLQTCKTVEEAYACAGRFLPRIFSRESGVLFRCHREQNILIAVDRWGEQ
ncbi:MAG: PAS domain S-box protein, partial [Syntrophales bacterium]|nr:PAS domain S-box protein [Syntrophales bacterium]